MHILRNSKVLLVPDNDERECSLPLGKRDNHSNP